MIAPKGEGLGKLVMQRRRRYGRDGNINRRKGEGSINSDGYRLLTINGKRVYEHIVLAEKALGRPLPKGTIVHHMNEEPADNYTPFNLVICPDQDYHLLLHRRMKELGYSKPKPAPILSNEAVKALAKFEAFLSNNKDNSNG